MHGDYDVLGKQACALLCRLVFTQQYDEPRRLSRRGKVGSWWQYRQRQAAATRRHCSLVRASPLPHLRRQWVLGTRQERRNR